MKKRYFVLLALTLALMITGCAEEPVQETPDVPEEDASSGESEIIIIESETVLPGGAPELEDRTETENGARIEVVAGENGGEIRWLVYDHIRWEDDFNGLLTTIESVAVTDEMVSIEAPEDYSRPVVIAAFTIENRSGQTFTTYPDLAVLITSSGEQIDIPDLWITDDLGGEISPGERKSGTVTWYLNSGSAENLDWIILKWYAFEGGEMDNVNALQKDYDVKLNLR